MSANPFRSSWIDGGPADRLKPHGSLSYVSGPTEEPLRFLTIPQLLDKTVARHGSRDAAIFDRTIDVHVTAIRRKLGAGGERIQTVRGFGYKFNDRTESQ